jgi:hypothetical protein
MNRELEIWRTQRNRLEDVLQEELKSTNKNLGNLELQIKDLEKRICEQVNVNRNLKCVVHENEMKLDALLMNIAQPVR